MNPRIAKEFRTQAPVFAFLAACAVALLAVGVVQAPDRFINPLPLLLGIYIISCLFMAATSFGNEFHLRTMSLLLSQPIARRKLWPEKMRVLAAFSACSAAITLLALMGASYVRWHEGFDLENALRICGILIFVPVLFCSTAPYFTLISNSTLGGIVFTIFGSGMLFAAGGEIWTRLSVIPGLSDLKDKLTFKLLDGSTLIFVILSIPYTAMLYRLGRRRFFRLEVIDSQALEASLPQGLETTLAGFSAKFKSPFSRLLFKELRLQRISLMLTAAFCFFIAVERITWSSSNDRTFVVAGTFCIYLFLFPVIVCATAVADEKIWGMKDWHLTLPPSLGQQWRVKWLVAFTLSIVLGGGLTWLLAYSGPWRKDMGLGWEPEMLCYPLLIAAALYAGSISASTIRALLLTFGMITAFAFINAGLTSVFYSFSFFQNFDTIELLLFVICVILVRLYSSALQLLWAVLVWPVYLVTHSRQKAGAVSGWADLSRNNLQVLLLVLCVAGFFWLLLRFARSNYRHSDLVKRKVAYQLVIILLAAIFLIVAIAGAQHAWHGVPVL